MSAKHERVPDAATLARELAELREHLEELEARARDVALHEAAHALLRKRAGLTRRNPSEAGRLAHGSPDQAH